MDLILVVNKFLKQIICKLGAIHKGSLADPGEGKGSAESGRSIVIRV